MIDLFFDVPDADLVADQLECVRKILDAVAVVDHYHDRSKALWCLAASLAIAARESGMTQEESEICFIATQDQVRGICDKLPADATIDQVITEEHVR